MIPEIFGDGSMKLNEDYTEILKLDRMLTEMNIPHETIRLMDGWQVWYPNKKGGVCDAIQHFGSYENKEDLLEIMGLLTEEEMEVEGGVLGYLTANEVCERIAKHYYGM